MVNDDIICVMSDAPSVHQRHPVLFAIGIALGALLLLPVLWVAGQTAVYYADLKKGGASLEDWRLDASISNLVANANVTPADLARLVPIGIGYPELGAPAAPVTIVEFIDYQCPFCQESAPSVRKVMAALGDRVRLIIRDFPITELHPGATRSALAAHCVLEQSQDLYWRYHDLLFSNVEGHTPEQLRDWAHSAGAEMGAFDACVASDRYLSQIDEDIQTGLRAGVQGTPTFFVNGVQFQGALDEKALTRVVNVLLEKARH